MISRDRMMQSAAVATGNGTTMDATGLANMAMQVSGTFVGTVTFEATINNTDWVSIQVVNIANGTISTTATVPGIYQCGIAGLELVRARVSIWTSGSITVRGFAVEAANGLSFNDIDVAATEDVNVLSIAAGNNNIGNVDVASIAAGSNNIGDVDVASIAAGDNNIGNVDIATIAAGDNNIGNVDVVTINSVAPQFDDTDKQAVSLYGRADDAGDIAIRTNPIGCLVSMDIKHWHLHKGRLFTAHIDNVVTNIGEMTVIAFNMPATGSFHLSTSAYSTHLADLNLYEDTSIDVDEGVDLVPVNRDRNAGISTTLTTIEATPEAGKVTYYLEAAAADANITKTTELDHEVIIGGDGPKALGASGGDDFGFELGNSKQYAVILTAGTNDDATHHLTISWCEYVG